MYRIEFVNNFDKSGFEKIPKDYQIKIKSFIEERIAICPHEVGKPLKGGLKSLWSGRVGFYRVIYRIDDDRIVVLVIRISHRKEVYK